ncbi:MAG TPA: hypothetical protein VK335_30300 [Bryobacteraceae bacterium]|nr:hypothetical protein [Bryobacteraceae bacterium]HZW94701.1 hypothetical protein [Candidatus Eremiobacteraceae bacterium]
MEKVKGSPANEQTRAPDSKEGHVLTWEVFVTPGIPIVTPDRPAAIKQTYFQAMAATLIYGVRDAVLVDAFMTVKQSTALAEWVAVKRQKPDDHLHHAWPWGPLVWRGHSS